MATDTMPDDDTKALARASGIPPRGALGASRNEMLALVLAVTVFALIVLAFWYQSSR
jgi:hypothetical protein